MRTWNGKDFWAYWTSDMLAPPLASTVSSVMSLGFTARETIPIVFFGFAICSCVITLTAKMGAQYSISFPVLVRSIFGMYGSYFAISVRAFVAAMWTGKWQSAVDYGNSDFRFTCSYSLRSGWRVLAMLHRSHMA